MDERGLLQKIVNIASSSRSQLPSKEEEERNIRRGEKKADLVVRRAKARGNRRAAAAARQDSSTIHSDEDSIKERLAEAPPKGMTIKQKVKWLQARKQGVESDAIHHNWVQKTLPK